MSTVECYDLHLYCDDPDCNRGDLTGGSKVRPTGPAFQAFAGRDQSEAYRNARSKGWVINPRREGEVHGGAHARCPKHA